MSQQLLDVTLNYWRAGLCVLPARADHKRPVLQEWKSYQSELPKEAAIRSWFPYHPGVCVLTGKISGNLEMLDFDVQGELFPHWLDLVRERAPELIDRLFIERSPSGGFHVVYRCQEPACGSIKLAEREVRVDDDKETVYRGKTYKPRKLVDGGFAIHPTLIETRGEGGLFLCYPTPGYVAEQGQLHEVPVLTGEEREILLDCAWSLNEHCRDVVGATIPKAEASGELRPGDDFNERGQFRELLVKHGWTLVRPGENEYWRRPGKSQGWSATLKKGVFFVFSSSAAPFEPQRGYSGFAVYAMLEHNGDFNKAAAALRLQGYAGPARTFG